jgi:hypothetical protein
VSGDFPILLRGDGGELPGRRTIVAGLCFAVLLAVSIPGILYLARAISDGVDGPLKKSPFAAVRWQQSQPEVKVGDEWFTLVSLDGLPASEIVAFSQKTYGALWRKRLEEDLVELLTLMGHAPGETVRLVVMPVGSHETRTLESVRLTSANRRAIREAAQGGKGDGPPRATGNGASAP